MKGLFGQREPSCKNLERCLAIVWNQRDLAFKAISNRFGHLKNKIQIHGFGIYILNGIHVRKYFTSTSYQ